ncbi:MAG: hypothetical protein AAFQ92_29445 [Bacteroidota bacterium]
MLNLSERIKELPTSEYEKIYTAFKDWHKSQNGAYINQRWNGLLHGKVKPSAEEALFFCNRLKCTIQQFFNPNFSFAENLREKNGKAKEKGRKAEREINNQLKIV